MGWEIAFWTCVAVALYPYLFYPLALAVAARLWGRPTWSAPGHAVSVSIIVAAHNEAAIIGRRVAELVALVRATAGGEVIVVSDGSTDGTVQAAQMAGGSEVRVIERLERGGKAAALGAAAASATGEILILADTRQTWSPNALAYLLENFADPDVGAVSGNLMVETVPGVMAGVGLYWRFEKWLRKSEGRLRAVVGVTGAIAAVRRELFRPPPPGTVLDDVYWPLCVAMQGYRVIYDGRAHAFDRLPDRPRDEFRRKVRTLSGNLQLAALLPGALLPWSNPIWWQFLSHKLARLVAPWALLGLLATNLVLIAPIYRLTLAAQLGLYALGLIGLTGGRLGRSRLSGAAGSFLVLNAAAWVAAWVWISGGTGASWKKVHYESVQVTGTP
jgi:biofilm PGA synthesis N-glycosyltransferase PgaC